MALTHECSHPEPAVLADRQRLSQILVNLLSNAIKYNRYGGRVTITCRPHDHEQATIVVADTGAGLSEADLRRIFVPFDRLGAEPATAGIPVAVLSAEAAPTVIRSMRESGVVAYLTKPLNLTEVGRLVDCLTARQSQRSGQPPRATPTR